MKKIIAFSGSNSKNSINQQLVNKIADLITDIEVEIINLRDFEAPVYGIDLETEDGFPDSMQALSKRFDSADGFIISTPEHNGSMPAVLKNTIDWLSRIEGKVFREKPTVFFSSSPGPRGGVSALEHLLNIMPYRGADVVGGYAVGPFSEHVTENGMSDVSRAEIQNLIDALLEKI